ncbi:kynB [Bugula neritina]|uniref:KynB n=1 Tax=Bugula neritina TaxID=10212 RepID=A0A7J7J9J7_BUGNE|nr:kynB [Bugula neritina]
MNRVGVDTPSVDYGPSLDFPVHRFLQGQNIFLLENVGNMSALPKGGDGVTLVVGAMKVDGGTGGPARLLALFEDASSGNIPKCTLLKVTIVGQIIALFV